MELSNTEKARLISKYGDWAIVTGGTSGIGYELALQLAKAGFNLIIAARNRNNLITVQNKLEELTNTVVIIVEADVFEEVGLNKIISAAEGLDIGLLIVSAGFGTSGRFLDNSIKDELNMITVNCNGLVYLTHYFGRQFVKNRKGGIILMSSMVAFQGTPFASNYAATKAFVQTLAEGLKEEFKPFGVDVLAAAPGPVESGFGKRANMKMSMYLTPSQVGVPILRALGKKTTVFPGILSKVLVYSLRIAPRNIKIKIMQKVMGRMTGN